MPDIHWHVGEDQDQETIAHASAPRRTRRSWIVIVIVVILGAGLGVAYRSIPEPAPRPAPTYTSTPRPTPTPPPGLPADLYAVIDREAQALVAGDFETYRNIHAVSMQNKVMGEREQFSAWGHPSDDRPMYEIVDFTLLTENQAWADIRQFRAGRYFRETRFYYRGGTRWLHGTPNDNLWSGAEEELVTQHFTLTFAVEDRSYIPLTEQVLEQDYEILCRQLDCRPDAASLRIQVTLRGNEIPIIRRSFSAATDIEPFELLLPSPRVAGIFEPAEPDDLAPSGVMWLAHILAEREAQIDLIKTQAGNVIVQAVRDWAAGQIDGRFDRRHHPLNPVGKIPPLPLEKLWSQLNRERTQAYFLAGEMIYFIDQEYGALAVAQLLHVLGSATSLRDAIENGLGVPFAEFNQKWQAWLQQNDTAAP